VVNNTHDCDLSRHRLRRVIQGRLTRAGPLLHNENNVPGTRLNRIDRDQMGTITETSERLDGEKRPMWE
jgi:hypothetical protein